MLKNLFNKPSSSGYSSETIDILRLIRSENVGPKTFISLTELFGSAALALENIADFSLRGGKKKPIKIFSKSEAEKEIELLQKNDSYLITYKDQNYSWLLLQTDDFPPVLTYKGNINLLNSKKCMAIVGARNCSMNARIFTKGIVEKLREAGFITVSGLARGIDTVVHSNSLDGTIAVMAGGIDYIYPPENEKLFNQITENSLVISELPIGTKPLSQHFPYRNRIISGVSIAVAVIEASLKSGSLITANMALQQNRDIFAVPGFPLDPRCVGTNRLIKQGAFLLESAEDIITNIISYDDLKKSLAESESCGNNFKHLANKATQDVNNRHRKAITELLSSTPITYEQIAEETELPLPVIYTVCLELELAGKVVRHSGNKISLLFE